MGAGQPPPRARYRRSIALPYARLLIFPIVFLTACLAVAKTFDESPAHLVLSRVMELERDLDAKAGLFVYDIESKEVIAHRADERFPLNSTFKLFACAALLARVEEGTSRLDAKIDLDPRDLVAWSPSVEAFIAEGRGSASLDELCAAMLAKSDNTAANLVLKEIGGPKGFTAYLRAIGDSVTRLDRWEPELNEGLPDDPRDTTTPRAIAASLETLLLGDSLTPASREKLRRWLSGHVIADDLFRSVLPKGWSIDDRTGAGDCGTRGIVAVIYPPSRGPIVAVTYFRDAKVSLEERNRAIARVGQAIVTHFQTEWSKTPR